MADSKFDKLDLSKLELDDLVAIQNHVLKQLALVTKANLGNLQAVHDSHSSNHGNNTVAADLQTQIETLANRRGGG